jgi:hypothetical protein
MKEIYRKDAAAQKIIFLFAPPRLCDFGFMKYHF